jgi:hypothetical protein
MPGVQERTELRSVPGIASISSRETMLTTDGADEDATPRRVAVTTISFSV